MTEEQLSGLETLLRAHDYAAAAYDLAVAEPTARGGEGGDAAVFDGMRQAKLAAREAYRCAAGSDAPALIAEVRRLRGIIAQHDLCHDLHGQVNAEDFARGCAAEQRRLYGCAPDADEVKRLRAALQDIADMYVYDDSDKVCWVGIAGRMSSRAEEAL